MITINKESIKKIQKLDLHDSELKKINCDYDKHTIKIPIILHSPNKKNLKAELLFLNVKYIEITFFEPWGSGFYINEVKITEEINKFETNNKDFKVTFLLNSGDKISIITNKIIYK